MARQFDVCVLADQTMVVVLQHDLTDDLSSRIVAPLAAMAQIRTGMRGVNPSVQIGEEIFRLRLDMLSAVPASELRLSISSIAYLRDEIVRGLDLLFSGV